MEIFSGLHLSYCTNIHPGENWQETYKSLKINLPAIRNTLSPDRKFGIGLRLSARAAFELLADNNLTEFRNWLEENNLYVFTMNGFPYGGFHNIRVKDNVHKPDWATKDRVNYTLALFNILQKLLPLGIEGGISTSPVSYKPWFQSDSKLAESVKQKAAIHYAEIALFLHETEKRTGKYMHLDIEPEPDGVLENSEEVIVYFKEYLFTEGAEYLSESLGISVENAIKIIERHINVCYDVCHFALAWEEPEDVVNKFRKNRISIGKVQISAALEVRFSEKEENIKLLEQLQPFAESTYLHQVAVGRDNKLQARYNDLEEGLEATIEPGNVTWRIHFHVPVFSQTYNSLFTTQDQILKVLKLLKKDRFCNHLEVETYTWEVLPEDLKLDLQKSIEREISFVAGVLKSES